MFFFISTFQRSQQLHSQKNTTWGKNAVLFYTTAKKKLNLKTLPKQSQILSVENCYIKQILSDYYFYEEKEDSTIIFFLPYLSLDSHNEFTIFHMHLFLQLSFWHLCLSGISIIWEEGEQQWLCRKNSIQLQLKRLKQKFNLVVQIERSCWGFSLTRPQFFPYFPPPQPKEDFAHTWFLVSDIDVKPKDYYIGQKCCPPINDKHHNAAQNGSNERNPHIVVFESRPPT